MRHPPELTSSPAVKTKWNFGLSRRQAGAKPADGPASSSRGARPGVFPNWLSCCDDSAGGSGGWSSEAWNPAR